MIEHPAASLFGPLNLGLFSPVGTWEVKIFRALPTFFGEGGPKRRKRAFFTILTDSL